MYLYMFLGAKIILAGKPEKFMTAIKESLVNLLNQVQVLKFIGNQGGWVSLINEKYADYFFFSGSTAHARTAIVTQWQEGKLS